MDAAGRVPRKQGESLWEAAPLRLRRAPHLTEAEDVLESFLGGDGGGEARRSKGAPAESTVAPAARAVCAPAAAKKESGIRHVSLRVPGVPQVEVGVDECGRVCLTVRLARDVRAALGALEEAEAWLRSSPEQVAVASVAARLDLSRGVRKHVVTGDAVAGMALRRAGIEVTGG